MGMFDDLEVADLGSVAEQEDKVGGSFAKFDSSGFFTGVIEKAYCGVSDGGAYFVDVTIKRKDDATVSVREYITSGTSKGCRNYYFVKDKAGNETTEKAYLPGYNKIKKLDLLLTSVDNKYPKTTKMPVMIWDKDAKKELPVEKEVISAWLGKEVGMLGHMVMEDSYSEPTKPRTYFNIEHFTDAKTKQTLNEKTAGTFGFADKYCSKFTPEFVNDKRKLSKNYVDKSSSDAPEIDVDEDEMPF